VPEWTSQYLLGKHDKHATGFFRSIDARVLLPAAFVAIVALAFAKRWYVPAIVFLVIFFITMYTTHSRKSYLKLLFYPFSVALFIFVIQAYTYGSTVVAIVIWPIYAQGIASGWLLCNRVLASVSILLLLVESKSQIELVEAMAWFKIPIEIRDLMSLMFRYVSVISEEITTMFNAQKSRLGYSTNLSWIKKLRNFGIMGGMLLVRSYDRSYRVVMSMMARGYTRNANIVHEFGRFAKKDYLFAVISSAIILGIVLTGVA
jgi:cobalt/nickel transport system permease protein